MLENLNLGSSEIIIMLAASTAMIILWLKSRSPKRYLKDWEAARNAGRHGPAARALEMAAGLTRKSDPADAARMSNEAGQHWLQADQPRAAVQALQNALTWWAESKIPADDYHADIVTTLATAKRQAEDARTASKVNENELRRRLALLSAIRNMLWYGGLFLIIIMAWKGSISYWWLVVPLLANIAIYLVMDAMEKR